MCEIAPFQMECVNDEYDLTCCRIHKLYCAITELFQSIPLYGRYIENYRCPGFEPKMNGRCTKCGNCL